MKGGSLMIWKKTLIGLCVAAACAVSGTGLSQAMVSMPIYKAGDQINAKTFPQAGGADMTLSFTGRPTFLLAVPTMYNKSLQMGEIGRFQQLRSRYGQQADFYILTDMETPEGMKTLQAAAPGIPILKGRPQVYTFLSSRLILIDKDGILRYCLPDVLDDAAVTDKVQEVLGQPAPYDVRKRQNDVQHQQSALISQEQDMEHPFIQRDFSSPSNFLLGAGIRVRLESKVLSPGGTLSHDGIAQEAGRVALLYYSQGEYATAREWTDKALAKEPGNADLYALRSSIDAHQDQWQASSDDLLKAIALAPDVWEYYSFDQVIAEKLNQPGRKAADLERVMALRKNVHSRFNVYECSWLYIKDGQVDKGLGIYQDYLSHDKNLAKGYLEYGVLNSLAKRYDDALKYFDEAQNQVEAYKARNSTRKDSFKAFTALVNSQKALVERQRGNYSEARRYADAAISLKPDERSYYGLRALIDQEDPQKAPAPTDIDKAFSTHKSVKKG